MGKRNYFDPSVGDLGAGIVGGAMDAYYRNGQYDPNAQPVDGLRYSPGETYENGYGPEAGGTAKVNARGSGGLERTRADGMIDSFDASGKYLGTSNDNNSMTAKDWATWAALMVGAYGMSEAAAGASAAGGSGAAGAGGTIDWADWAAAELSGAASNPATAAQLDAWAAGSEIAGAGAGGLEYGLNSSQLVDEATASTPRSATQSTPTAQSSATQKAAEKGAEKGIIEKAGDFVTKNKLAPSMLNMAGSALGRYASASAATRADERARRRYAEGYRSGNGLSIWSRSKRSGP